MLAFARSIFLASYVRGDELVAIEEFAIVGIIKLWAAVIVGRRESRRLCKWSEEEKTEYFTPCHGTTRLLLAVSCRHCYYRRIL
jgi:hypothetical protein